MGRLTTKFSKSYSAQKWSQNFSKTMDWQPNSQKAMAQKTDHKIVQKAWIDNQILRDTVLNDIL